MNIWTRPARDPHFDLCQALRVAAFDKVAPKGNWKGPIAAWIDVADLEACDQAALYFTGAGLTVTSTAGFRCRVTAPGYYATIGA